MGDPDTNQQYTGVVDLRVVDRLERLPLLELTLQSLTAGEDLLVMTGERPERLHQYITQQYGGRFQWQPVEEGPDLWRVRLVCEESAGKPE